MTLVSVPGSPILRHHLPAQPVPTYALSTHRSSQPFVSACSPSGIGDPPVVCPERDLEHERQILRAAGADADGEQTRSMKEQTVSAIAADDLIAARSTKLVGPASEQMKAGC